jgi:hypothetical protein
MRPNGILDPQTEVYLLRAEEVLAGALASKARRALLRDSRPPRPRARVWLGSVLLAIGHRLLRGAPGPAAPA